MNNSDDANQLNWPPTGTLLPFAEASIYLCFHGLMCLAYNSDYRRLEAGMHSKAPQHRFRIDVFAFVGDLSVVRHVYSFTPDSYNIPGGLVTVDISTPRDPGVCFYLPATEDEFSWAQILDLEGPEFYNRKLKKNRILKPRIHINHGQFCAIPTPRRFTRLDADATTSADVGTDIGTIAYLGLGLVRHEGTGLLEIITEEQKISLPASTDHPLLVLFSNSCPVDECDQDQNDFPLYYKAIKLKGQDRKYRLEPGRRTGPGISAAALTVFERLLLNRLLREIFSNQNAPCGMAGYGRSNGIDDSAGS